MGAPPWPIVGLDQVRRAASEMFGGLETRGVLVVGARGSGRTSLIAQVAGDAARRDVGVWRWPTEPAAGSDAGRLLAELAAGTRAARRGGGVVAVLDDADDQDPLVVALAVQSFEAGDPTYRCLIGVRGGRPLGPDLARLRRRSDVLTIELRGLGVDDVIDLARRRAEDLSIGRAAWLIEVSEGRPAVVRALWEHGLVDGSEGVVLGARIARLPAAARSELAEVAQRVLGTLDPRLIEAAEELAVAGPVPVSVVFGRFGAELTIDLERRDLLRERRGRHEVAVSLWGSATAAMLVGGLSSARRSAILVGLCEVVERMDAPSPDAVGSAARWRVELGRSDVSPDDLARATAGLLHGGWPRSAVELTGEHPERRRDRALVESHVRAQTGVVGEDGIAQQTVEGGAQAASWARCWIGVGGDPVRAIAEGAWQVGPPPRLLLEAGQLVEASAAVARGETGADEAVAAAIAHQSGRAWSSTRGEGEEPTELGLVVALDGLWSGGPSWTLAAAERCYGSAAAGGDRWLADKAATAAIAACLIAGDRRRAEQWSAVLRTSADPRTRGVGALFGKPGPSRSSGTGSPPAPRFGPFDLWAQLWWCAAATGDDAQADRFGLLADDLLERGFVRHGALARYEAARRRPPNAEPMPPSVPDALLVACNAHLVARAANRVALVVAAADQLAAAGALDFAADAIEPLLDGSKGASATRAQLRLQRWRGGTHPAPMPTPGLTDRELQVARLAATGRSSKEIAAKLAIGRGTVDNTLQRVYRKLGIRGRRQLREVMEDRRG